MQLMPSVENVGDVAAPGKSNPVAHFRVALSLFFYRGQVQNHSYGYKFYLHVKENSFSYEWFCTWPLSEKEAKSNSEMGYWIDTIERKTSRQ